MLKFEPPAQNPGLSLHAVELKLPRSAVEQPIPFRRSLAHAGATARRLREDWVIMVPTSGAKSVAKMPDSSEDHGEADAVGGGDYVFVFD